jgi:hypothetical protein
LPQFYTLIIDEHVCISSCLSALCPLTHTNTNAHTNTSTYTLITIHPCTHSYARPGSLQSITEELERTRERAEKAEKLIFDLNHSVTDSEHCMYDSNMERTIPYEQAILALKENIQRLDSERVRLQETLDLRDSAMMLLTADLDRTLDSMKGGYELVLTEYEFYFCSFRMSWICFFLLFGLCFPIFVFVPRIAFIYSLTRNAVCNVMSHHVTVHSEIFYFDHPFSAHLFLSTLRITELEESNTDLQKRLLSVEENRDTLL